MKIETVRVLIVEDNPDLRFLQIASLKAFKTCNYEVSAVGSLAEAREALDKDQFDVILLDLDLPDSKGVDTVSRIYEDNVLVPIVAITGAYSESIANDVLSRGAQDYLIKSKYEDDTLDRVIHYSIARKKVDQKLKSKIRRSEVIFKLLQDITSDISSSDMLGLIVGAAKSIVVADTASIILLDAKEKSRPKVMASKSSESKVNGSLLRPSLDGDTSITGWVVKNKRSLLLFDSHKDEERFKNIKWKEGIKCSINVPIIFKDSVKGTLNLNITGSDVIFTEDDLEAVEGLADHAAIALENSGLYKTMKDKYITDLKVSNDELKIANENLQKTRDQLIQSEKMSAVGQLASGVAHEINNPLSGILGNVQIIKMEMRSGSKIEDADELLNIIEDAAKRCKSITQNLLDFSRIKKDRFESFNVHKALDSVAMLLNYSLKNSNITMEKRYAETLPQASGNTNEIQQVFLNMISNAKWAIEKKEEESGAIVVETRKVDNNFLEVRFSDTGIGMSKETIKKIFDPFYTTKEVGKGTGLGLSLCYEIMRRHNGDLNAESAEGRGATFIIKLPIAKDADGKPLN